MAEFLNVRIAENPTSGLKVSGTISVLTAESREIFRVNFVRTELADDITLRSIYQEFTIFIKKIF